MDYAAVIYLPRHEFDRGTKHGISAKYPWCFFALPRFGGIFPLFPAFGGGYSIRRITPNPHSAKFMNPVAAYRQVMDIVFVTYIYGTENIVRCFLKQEVFVGKLGFL